jgi:hypothetical protein
LRFRRLGSSRVFLVLVCLVVAIFVGLRVTPTGAQTPQELADAYAPVLHFTSGEKFYPVMVDYIIDSSVLKLRASDGSSSVVDSNPTVFNLGGYLGSDLFLDNELESSDAIAADYSSKVGSLGYTVYAHVVSSGGYTVVQYWLLYAFNNGPLNDHQGDIEVVEVFLDASMAPVKALYSQHGAGENAEWGDVEKVDAHPVVYVAQGSHANYFRPYQGRIFIENDVVGGDGRTIMPVDLNVVLLGEEGSHPADQSWLDFEGRWGFWGTDSDAALGRAGPVGPVFNQNGDRWAAPLAYLDSTYAVGANYFILAWVVANVLLFFLIYVVARAAWDVWGIWKLHKKGGLRVMKFLRGPGGVGLMLGIVAIALTVVGLFLPWYTIAASSESGPLAGQGGVTLMNIDGIGGMRVNLFMGSGGDSTSGLTSLFSMSFPWALFIGVGVVLLALDVVGVKSGKRLGLKFMLGAITLFLPFVLILVFMTQLPAFLPWASSLVPGQQVPPQLDSLVYAIAGNPFVGSMSQAFPVVGVTSVWWGFGVGAYLFVVAAVVRIVGGFMMRRTPELEEKPVTGEKPAVAGAEKPAQETSPVKEQEK